MISKCANPGCHAVFRYLHEGKLFEFEMRSEAVREIECFWLCDTCASTMTLFLEPETQEVVIVPLDNDVSNNDLPGYGDAGPLLDGKSE